MSVRGDILDAIEVQLDSMRDSPGTYPLEIAATYRFGRLLENVKQEQFPAVCMLDPGEEQLVVRDATHYCYRMPLLFVGLVKSGTGLVMEPAALQTAANNMLATLKQFIDAFTCTETGYMSLYYTEQSDVAWAPTAGEARVDIDARLLFACENGTF